MQRKNFFKNSFLAAAACLIPGYVKVKAEEPAATTTSGLISEAVIERNIILTLVLSKRLIESPSTIDVGGTPVTIPRGFQYILESRLCDKMMCKTSWFISEEEETKPDFVANQALLIMEHRAILLQETLRWCYIINQGSYVISAIPDHGINIEKSKSMAAKRIEQYLSKK